MHLSNGKREGRLGRKKRFFLKREKGRKMEIDLFSSIRGTRVGGS